MIPIFNFSAFTQNLRANPKSHNSGKKCHEASQPCQQLGFSERKYEYWPNCHHFFGILTNHSSYILLQPITVQPLAKSQKIENDHLTRLVKNGGSSNLIGLERLFC